MHARRKQRVGHLILTVAFQQQIGERVGAVLTPRGKPANHDILEPVVRRIQPVAIRAQLR